MAHQHVQCFARGVPGSWEAICIDFDIAVQGSSYDDVRAMLDEAIASYVVDAQREDARTSARLLSRRSPLFVRVKLVAGWILHQFRHDRSLSASFDLPCPA